MALEESEMTAKEGIRRDLEDGTELSYQELATKYGVTEAWVKMIDRGHA